MFKWINASWAIAFELLSWLRLVTLRKSVGQSNILQYLDNFLPINFPDNDTANGPVSMSRDVGRHWAASSSILQVMEWTPVPEKIASLQNLPIFMIFASALSDQIIVLGQINCLIKKCYKTEQIYFIALLNRIYNATFIFCSLCHTTSDCWESRPILTSFLHSAAKCLGLT